METAAVFHSTLEMRQGGPPPPPSRSGHSQGKQRGSNQPLPGIEPRSSNQYPEGSGPKFRPGHRLTDRGFAAFLSPSAQNTALALSQATTTSLPIALPFRVSQCDVDGDVRQNDVAPPTSHPQPSRSAAMELECPFFPLKLFVLQIPSFDPGDKICGVSASDEVLLWLMANLDRAWSVCFHGYRRHVDPTLRES